MLQRCVGVVMGQRVYFGHFILQVKCTFPSGDRMVKVPQEYKDLFRAVATGNENVIINNVFNTPSLKKTTLNKFCSLVNSEVENYCKIESQSILRTKGKDGNELKTFSFSKLEEELEVKTPLFWRVVNAAAYNPCRVQNKKKTNEAVKPAIVAAAAKVISIHTEEMNVYKKVNSIILKKAGLKKRGFIRLGKTYDTVSYGTVNDILDMFAENYQKTINMWKSEVERPLSNHPGYALANDNVDWEVRRRHITTSNQKKSIHKVNVIAYKNRVNSCDLPDNGPQQDIKEVPLQDMLPGAEDTVALTNHLVVLVGNLWADTFPSLAWFKEILPAAIPHPYEKQMKARTDKTQLGLFNYHQTVTDEVEEMLIELHSKFVPNHSSDDDPTKKPTRTILHADYLGFERQKKA